MLKEIDAEAIAKFIDEILKNPRYKKIEEKEEEFQFKRLPIKSEYFVDECIQCDVIDIIMH